MCVHVIWIQLYKRKILLGHIGGYPQPMESVACPLQFRPPNKGFGLLHCRVRFFRPLPHDTEHGE